MIEEMEAVGYLGGSTPATEFRNVVVHDRTRAQSGLNFYTSGHAAEAILMDMDGNVLHRWGYPFKEVWPSFPGKTRAAPTGMQYWRRAYLYENGDILAIFEGFGILKLDRDSNLIWARPNNAHHDLEVMPNGDIFVLTRTLRPKAGSTTGQKILEDFVSVLSPDGRTKRRCSVLKCIEQSPFRTYWEKSPRQAGDVFHTNSIEVLTGALESEVPVFKKGNVLVSMLMLDLVAVLDLEQSKAVWAVKGGFRRQHDPTELENKNILLFDNRGHRGRSSVLEIDPKTRKVEWRYMGTKEHPFFSVSCGTARRLRNGNTLITESDRGRAFEVTRDGEIVWEFYNPHRAGGEKQFVATLFEMLRLPSDFPTGWLGER